MKFRKKPVEVEAWQWNGYLFDDAPKWVHDAVARDVIYFYKPGQPEQQLMIRTLEGPMTASKEDWLICGVLGEIYACKPDAFAKTYERVGVSTVLREEPTSVQLHHKGVPAFTAVGKTVGFGGAEYWSIPIPHAMHCDDWEIYAVAYDGEAVKINKAKIFTNPPLHLTSGMELQISDLVIERTVDP